MDFECLPTPRLYEGSARFALPALMLLEATEVGLSRELIGFVVCDPKGQPVLTTHDSAGGFWSVYIPKVKLETGEFRKSRIVRIRPENLLLYEIFPSKAECMRLIKQSQSLNARPLREKLGQS